jgi:glycosyltransferase involved in cell wall biosynthesis
VATILFYSPFNQRSRDTESLMIGFSKQGHQVISLSQQEGFFINEFLRAEKIEAHSYVMPGPRSGWWYYFRHLIYFIRFCWQRNPDVVYCHLEAANFVGAVGQYFIKSKVYLCRHHINEALLYNFDKNLSYRITYKLAKKVIVVSEHARRYMIEKEKIPAHKITHINLAYDFSLYSDPGDSNVKLIRKQYDCDILLVSVCRLTQFKRPDVAIKTLKRLVDQGQNSKLVLLGKGEMLEDLKKLIAELSLQDRVYMPGFVSNVLEYMKAADFFIHPSILDSSCVAVKEAGLVSKPVIACKGIGDFDDYIVNGVNGFTVDPKRFDEEAASVILKNHKNQEILLSMGEQLRCDVLTLFSAQNILPQYASLNKCDV